MGSTTRRKVRDQAEAREFLGRLSDSDMGLPEFCARHGIDGRSLSCWRRNLKRRRDPDMASLTPSPQRLRLFEVLPATTARPPATYRVHVGDVVVELDDSFDEGTLARLLGVVTRC